MDDYTIDKVRGMVAYYRANGVPDRDAANYLEEMVALFPKEEGS